MIPDLSTKKARQQFSAYGKTLIGHAFDEMYYFEDDEVEEAIDKALLKFQNDPEWRNKTKSYLWSNEKLRNKICQVAFEMYAPREED